MEQEDAIREFGDFHLKVREFQKKMGFPTQDFPTPMTTPLKLVFFRMRLMYEELYELMEAIDQNEFDKMLDAYGDLLYVVVGFGVTLGLPTQAIFDEVHRSNMTKDVMNKYGKGGKGPNFEEPNLIRVLARHIELQLSTIQVAKDTKP